MAYDPNNSWLTIHEIKFINSIGTNLWSQKSDRVRACTRTLLLQKYLKSCDNRQKWGGVDKKEVVAFVQKLLNTERCELCNQTLQLTESPGSQLSAPGAEGN